MATIITARNGQHAYPLVLERIVKSGDMRAPNGRQTLDLGFTVIELESPFNALPLGVGRGVSRAIAVAEAAQLIGGFASADLILKAAPRFKEYMNGDHFHGAYGRRIGHQALNAVTKLKMDPQSRRAVITLWDPLLDNQPGKLDYPCTVALQLEMVGDQLCMNTVMRSNDAWLGLPYDMFQFTQLQLSVCNSLDVEPGWYRHTALSLHLYAENMEAATTNIRTDGKYDLSPQPAGFGQSGDSFTTIMRRARAVSMGGVNENDTVSEAWYRREFETFLGRDVDDASANDGAAKPVLA